MFFQRDYYLPELNFAAREPFLPFFSSLMRLFQARTGAEILDLFFLLFAAGLGVYLLVRILGGKRFSALLAGAFFILILLFLFGQNQLFLRACWFPVLLASLLYTRKARVVFALPVFLLVLLVWCASAGSLAPFGLFAALLLAQFLAWFTENRAADDRPSLLQLMLPTILLASAFLVSGVTYHVYPMPDYPWYARLVPVSPLQFRGEPLLAAYYHPNSIYYPAYAALGRSILLRAGGVFAIFIACAAVPGVRGALRLGSFRLMGELLALSCVTMLFSVGEWVLEPYLSWENLAFYLPYSSLSRMVPGLSHAALPWLLLPFGLVPVTVLFFSKSGQVIQVLAVVLCCFFVVCCPNGGLQAYASVVPGATAQLCQKTEDTAQCMLRTPSGFLLRSLGLWAARPGENQRREFESLRRLQPGVDFQASVYSEPLSEEAHLALDSSLATRWRTARAQRPGDFFQLEFDRPVKVLRLVLSVRDVPADFPRGVRVQVRQASEKDLSLVTVIEQPDWFGPVRWTQSGFPYFGPQSEVILDFPDEQEVTLIKFTQIGTESRFDWSIQEIKLWGEL
jgi:hypothetical protein